MTILDNEGNEFIDDNGVETVKSVIIDNLSNVIQEGRMIKAVLITAIDSSLEGLVKAVVPEDVYSEDRTKVLLPKGTTILGKYKSFSSGVSRSQYRIGIEWDKIIRNDGVQIAFNAPATDQFGRSGTAAEYKSDFLLSLAKIALFSIFNVGGAIVLEKVSGTDGLSSTTNTGSTIVQQKPSDIAILNATKNIAGFIEQKIDSSIQENPRSIVPSGQKLFVFVNKTLEIPDIRK